jgi:PAS domain S-box-containing protein
MAPFSKLKKTFEDAFPKNKRSFKDESLKQSEKKYRRLVESAHEGIVMADENDILTFVNKRFASSLGYSIKELIGKNVRELANEESVQMIKQETKKRLRGIKSTYEITLIHKQGNEIHFAVSVSPILDKQGNFVGSFGVFANITDLTNAKQQLERRLHFQKTVSKCVSVLAEASAKSFDKKIQAVLRSVLKLTGVDLIYIYELDHEDPPISVKQLFFSAAPNKKHKTLKSKIRTQDLPPGFLNSLVNNEVYGMLHETVSPSLIKTFSFSSKTKSVMILPIFSKKKLWGFIGFNHMSDYAFHYSDVHFFKAIVASIGTTVDRLESERRLKERENRYRDLFDNISSGVVVYDSANGGKDFIIKNVNKASERVDNIKKEDVIGHNVMHLFPNTEKYGLLSVFQRVWRTGKPEHIAPWYYEDKCRSGWREHYVYKLGSGEIISSFIDVTKRKRAEIALSESENKYRSMVDQSMMGVLLVHDEKVSFANREMAKIFGYASPSEMIGRPIRDFFAPSSLDCVKGMLRALMQGRKKSELSEFVAVKKNGKKIYIQSLTKMISVNGKQMVQSFVRDITENKQMELKLNERVHQINVLYRIYSHFRIIQPINQTYAKIVEDIYSGLADKDYVKCRIVADDKIHQYPRNKKVIKESIREPLIVDGIRRGHIEVGFTRKPSTEAIRMQLKDQKKLIANVARTLSKFMFTHEIVDRHKKIVNKAFTALFIAHKGKILYTNPRFLKMFKCRESDVIGADVSKFLPKCCTELSSADGRLRDCKGVCTNGQEIYLVIAVQKITYQGKASSLVRINDVTDLKQAQLKLKNFNKELKESVAQKTKHLEEANKRLQSINQLKDEFIAVTSHELRSPLTSIRGFLSFLVENESLEAFPEHLRQYLLKAYSTTESLNYLINNILDVSRLDMGRFELQKSPNDLVALTRSIVDSLSFQTQEKRLTLKFVDQTGPQGLTFNFDAIRISQVLRNLLDNSIKFSKRDKTVQVTVSRKDPYAVITVYDQGVGIPQAKINQIFDKFVQLKAINTNHRGGVGLGLFIVKRIVELHGGKISASKNKPTGLIMTIKLPLE